jgi:hypothetical protein
MLIMGTLQIDRYIGMDMFFGIEHDKRYNDVADAKRVANILDQDVTTRNQQHVINVSIATCLLLSQCVTR